MSTPEAANDDEPLLRQLTAWGIWLLAVNSMIGAGIFGVPAGAAALTGPFSPLVFLGCGLLLAAVLLCLAEVASHFRGTGGPIVYLRTAFGPMAGFQAGWAFYLARVTAFAANTNLLVATLAFFWTPAGSGVMRLLLLALVIGALAFVNIIGARQAMRSIGVLTVLKFLPLLILCVAGLAWIDPGELLPASTTLPPIVDFGTAALIVIYAFVGWENALVPAGETKDPARNMPKGLFWALGLVTLLYVLIQVVSLSVLPELGASESPLVDVGAALFGPMGALLITVGVIVSVGGNLAGAMFTAPRLTYALGREGALPAWFSAVHPLYRTPSRSILVFAIASFLLAAYGSFLWLAAMSSLVRVGIYMACIAAMPQLRKRFPDATGYRVPLGWTIPIGAFLVCGILLSQVEWLSLLVTAVVLLIGAGIYAWTQARRMA
ncbi:MAG: amino acid permease [Gammaproteobacteria bacterium]|nr:amino acid permease [Gammaproteobacteria bacterium]